MAIVVPIFYKQFSFWLLVKGLRLLIFLRKRFVIAFFCFKTIIGHFSPFVKIKLGEFMKLFERIKFLRLESGKTQKQISAELNIDPSAYRRWESGRSNPKKDSLEKLAKVFNVSVSYLLGETDVKSSSELIEMMEHLPTDRQEKVLEVVEQVAENDGLSLHVTRDEIELHKYYVLPQALSAGYGKGYTDELECDIVYSEYKIKYDQAVWIKGDSMEPTFPDHNVALIKEQPFLEYEGQICAVDDVENGNAYIKRVYLGKEGYILKSINQEIDDQSKRKYPDIFLPFDEDPRIIGKVVGHFTPEEI